MAQSGPPMLEGRVLKYISPVGSLPFCKELSNGDRRDCSRSECGAIVRKLTLKNVSNYKCDK